MVVSGCTQIVTPALQVTSTSTPEPIVPTRTLAAALATPAAAAATPAPATTTLAPSPTAATTSSPVSFLPVAPEQKDRFGITGDPIDVVPGLDAGLSFHHYLSWQLILTPLPESLTGWQTVRLSEAGTQATWEEIESVLITNPGSIWLIGNEPDVRWQDNVTAERYAEIYHDVYTSIKERDPTAQIAIGGISQPTSLRLAYLDRILETYQARYGEPMPVDIWNIHTFVLREELDSWGIGIPPGMDETAGQLLEISDHGNIDLFRQYILDFRAWMAARGYADRPLAITEMGILLPPDYGFPPQFVADYMRQVFDFLLTAANETGYPADDGRLVQYWFWYSLYDPGAYPTGNLYDRETQSLTPLGRMYVDYWVEWFGK